MPTRRTTAPDEIVLAIGEVTGVDHSVSFGRGHHDQFGVTPWSGIVTMEVVCHLTDWTYNGVDVLRLSMTRDRRFEDPDRVRAIEEEPLPDVGFVDTHKDVLTAFSFVPPTIFDSIRAILTCGKPAFVLVYMTRPYRRKAFLRDLQFTTDRSEIE